MSKWIFIMGIVYPLGPATAQVSIAPTAVFLDQQGIGTVYIGNTGTQAQEVRIQFVFGYPGQDTAGEIQMIYGDSLRERSHGLGPSIKAYPSAFTLPAQSQQMVRILLKNRTFVRDGLYFSRLKITSQAQTPVEDRPDSGAVGTQVSFKFEQFLPVFFMQGKVRPQVKVEPKTLESDYRYGALRFDYTCEGDIPYLGKLRYRLIHPSPGERPQSSLPWKEMEIALYFQGNRRCLLPWPETLGSGKHCLELEFHCGRNDMPVLNQGQNPDYQGKVHFELP